MDPMDYYKEVKQDIEEDIKRNEEQIEIEKVKFDLFVSLERLAENPDFIKVIDNAYFDSYKNKQVCLLGSGRLQEDTRKEVIRDIDGVSRLDNFLAMIQRQGKLAEENMEQAKLNIIELQSQGMEVMDNER